METAVNEANEDSAMVNTERILISNAGIPSEYDAVIDPSKTCYTTTTRLLREIGLFHLAEPAIKDDKHSEMHQGDGYISTVQLKVRSEFMKSWTTRSFCVIESDIKVVVLNKPLNPSYLQTPSSGMLPMVNDSSFSSAGESCLELG
jgi:hypothetical protein